MARFLSVGHSSFMCYNDGSTLATSCWGSNQSGQLGALSPNLTEQLPVRVRTNETFAAVATGASHTCAINMGGQAFCWGDDTDGKLGGAVPGNAPTPQPVDTTLLFEKIAAGLSFTCGVTTVGEIFCWGRNERGQLGNGSATSSRAPVRIAP